MKATIIDTLKYRDDSICFSEMIAESLKKRNTISEVIKTGKMNIIPCMGCDGCLYKQPGRCIMKDNTSDILTPISKNEILVCLTEIKYGGYSSEFKLIVDKFALLATPYYQMAKEKLVHKKRYPNPKQIYVIGITRYVDKEANKNFSRIVHNNAINLNIGIYGSYCLEKELLNKENAVNVAERIMNGDLNG